MKRGIYDDRLQKELEIKRFPFAGQMVCYDDRCKYGAVVTSLTVVSVVYTSLRFS
ncbi:hypothetical protein D3C77_461440 [compost metagenome]